VTGSLSLIGTGTHSAAGVLTWAAWSLLRDAGEVLGTEDVDDRWEQAFADAGVQLSRVAAMPAAELAARLVATAASGEDLVWFVSPDGDPGLGECLTRELVRRSSAGAAVPEVEMVLGSWDQPGAGLLELVEIMDRLRSPGGCPWDAEQTHASLLPYALEEAYEVAEAVEQGDREALVEELGDLLLQVVFHARIAQEDGTAAFDIDEVAAGIVTKLRRRHPHVFSDAHAPTAAHVEASWERIKAEEKGRESVFDGVPVALPALARADKVLGRLERAVLPGRRPTVAEVPLPDDLGAHLLGLVAAARRAGADAEAALRQAVRETETAARAGERGE